MTERYYPLEAGFGITSPFGRSSGRSDFHTGIDFGNPVGSPAGWPVYAIQAGTVLYSGQAQGYGGPDPAGWIVIDSDDSQGSGVFEYGHVVREGWVRPGAAVAAGQRIGTINPDKATNAGVDPHLHVSYMPREYNPSKKQDFSAMLKGLKYPGGVSTPTPEPTPAPTGGTEMATDGQEVRTQMRGPGDNGWEGLAPQPDDNGVRWSAFRKTAVKAQTLVEAVGTLVFEMTLRLPIADRGYQAFKMRKSDTLAGNAASAAAIAAENREKLDEILAELKKR